MSEKPHNFMESPSGQAKMEQLSPCEVCPDITCWWRDHCSIQELDARAVLQAVGCPHALPAKDKIITAKRPDDLQPNCVWVPKIGQYVRSTANCFDGLDVEGVIVAIFDFDIVVRMPDWYCGLQHYCHYDNHAELVRGKTVELAGCVFAIERVHGGSNSLFLRRCTYLDSIRSQFA